uniref:Lipase domain-containing protein n=1 Tax=Capra hircus TaxID=9925 RepID=A0A8C2P3M0_CAPHI
MVIVVKNLPANAEDVRDSENKAPCLEFSHLSLKDSFRDLFNPKMEISLMLYTRNNPTCAESLFEKNDALNVNFNTSKKVVWLIHGYRPLGSTPSWLQNFVRILLNQDDMNIIVVDWNQGATTFLYIRAVKNTRKVAVSLSRYIQNLLVSLEFYGLYMLYNKWRFYNTTKW